MHTFYLLVGNHASLPHYLLNFFWRQTALAAENLFLRKQLAFFVERDIRPRRANRATRLLMVFASKLFDWRQSLVLVKPDTFIRWHRRGFRLFWKWKSRGRKPLPKELRHLIEEMARDNRTWGEERIANELSVKLGIRISPRTVRKYMFPFPNQPKRDRNQNWATFVRNHARQIVACDFCTVVTATFRILYVLVVMEIGSRRLLHVNVTSHPSAEWTLQQLREAIPCDHSYRFLIHDRDRIYSQDLDQHIRNLSLRVLKTPVQAPQANSFCERLVESMRRDCLDFFIPLGENSLRKLLQEWKHYYNKGRVHSRLGPGLPEPAGPLPESPNPHRHRLPEGHRVSPTPIFSGLHHDYRLDKLAA